MDDGRPWAWAVAGLTGLALALRLVNLDSGLWVDEISSLLGSFRAPLREIVGAFPRDNHHPLYSVLAHVSLRLFGEAPWVIRLPAAVFGVATVPLLYALGVRLMGRREALLAAALLVVSFHHVWFSQNARGYSMLTFATVLCTLLLLRVLAHGGWGPAAGYAVVAALGAYTHLTMVFVVGGHAVVCAAYLALPAQAGLRVRRGRGVLAMFLLGAALTLLLYAPVLAQVRTYFADTPSALRGVSTPGWAVAEGARVLAVGFAGGRVMLGAAVIGVAGALFAAGLVDLARRRPLALALFIAPAALTVAGALVARGTMYPRFFFSLIGFGILIGVRGAFVGSAWFARRLSVPAMAERLGTLAVVAGIALSTASLVPAWRLPKQDFVGAMRYVDTARRPGDVVATTGVTVIPYRDYLGRDWSPVASAGDIGRLRAGGRVWLVYAFPRYLERGAPGLRAVVDRDCGRARVFPGTLGGGDIHVCLLDGAP
jgi:hypothetical protein